MSSTIEPAAGMAIPSPSAESSNPNIPIAQSRVNWKELDWGTVIPLLASAALLAVLAWPMIVWWNYEFTKPETYYGHAPMIPFIVALMLWYRRDALAAVPKKPCPAALAILLPALALLVVAQKREMQALMSAGFLISIWSGAWLVFGTRFLRAAAFPLAFLLLMAPLPGPLLNDATQRVQMASTVVANKMLHCLTFGTTLSGNVIKMENFQLFVDVPCSGFKLLLSMLTFSAAFAYLVDGVPKKRVGLFLFSLPLSLVVNSFRIALIGIVGECIGSDAAHVFHDYSGLITLGLGFIALFSVAKVIGCRKFAGWPIF